MSVSMAAMLRDSVAVDTVVHTHPRAIPLAMITMRSFLLFPMSNGAPLGGRWSSAIIAIKIECYILGLPRIHSTYVCRSPSFIDSIRQVFEPLNYISENQSVNTPSSHLSIFDTTISLSHQDKSLKGNQC